MNGNSPFMLGLFHFNGVGGVGEVLFLIFLIIFNNAYVFGVSYGHLSAGVTEAWSKIPLLRDSSQVGNQS